MRTHKALKMDTLTDLQLNGNILKVGHILEKPNLTMFPLSKESIG